LNKRTGLDIKMLINGELVEAKSGQVLESVNPATEEILGTAPLAGEADVDKAVQSAARAFAQWSKETMDTRAKYLRQLADAVRDRAEEIALVETLDTGNTLARVRHDIEKSIESLEYYAGLGYELTGRTVPASTSANLHLTVREPYGVCARIVPFNHPFLFIASRVAAPLMTGNTLVLKPAEQSPLSSGIFSEIAAEVLPPGVVNIVTGDGRTGDALVRHPQVPRIAFIGSVQTGLRIQQAAAESGRVKHVTLELGGKNPMILFPDAHWELAVEGAVKGMGFSWQGQSCGSTSRLIVHESIYDKTVAAVVDKVSKIRLGDPVSPVTDMGPVNSAAQYAKVMNYIEIAKADGAVLAYGGKRPEGMDKGYWVLPTVFVDVTPDMRIAQEEVFGPVLSIMKFRTEEEALQIANGIEYGLTGAVWTNDLNKAIKFAKNLQCGYVWVNNSAVHYPQLPFGGYKQSGVGSEEGIEELLSYTQLKSIHFIQQTF
jgi:acyl-CoA reductase-like NAD-dependent aldehyde dehydrogenase